MTLDECLLAHRYLQVAPRTAVTDELFGRVCAVLPLLAEENMVSPIAPGTTDYLLHFLSDRLCGSCGLGVAMDVNYLIKLDGLRGILRACAIIRKRGYALEINDDMSARIITQRDLKRHASRSPLTIQLVIDTSRRRDAYRILFPAWHHPTDLAVVHAKMPVLDAIYHTGVSSP